MVENIEKHVMVSHGKQFSEICNPIFRVTPINYVGLARLYPDGSRSYLISNPEWGKILLKNKYHLAGTEDALIHGPEFSHQLWSLSSMFTLNQQTQNLFQDCVANNYGNGITLIERGIDFVEFIHICANTGYERSDPYLVHHIDELWNYVLYIRETLAQNKELKSAYDKKYQYNLILPDRNVHLHANNNLKMRTKKYYLGGYFDDVYFTSKEMDCLILLYQGKTIKEIAKSLNISPRTVESYIKDIKLKVKSTNKTSIILELPRNNLFKSLLRSHQIIKFKRINT